MSEPLDFSVVIPTRNRPERLRQCLAGLDRLDYPRSRFEVVVVDDGGDASLEPVIATMSGRMCLRLIRQGHRGPAAARNTGADAATGRYLAFTDDDCEPASDWLSALSETLARRPDQMVGGRMVNALRENPFSVASQVLIDHLYDYYNADPHNARFLVSANLSVPAEAYRKLTGFDSSYPEAAAEDRDLCARWLGHGFRIAYSPQAVVEHRHELNLRTFWRQHAGYGRGAFRFRASRRGASGAYWRVEPPRFYWRLLTRPLPGQNQRAFTLRTLLLLSQAANAAGFFRAAWHRDH